VLSTLLPQLGLSLEETHIYQSLLQNGPQTVAQLTLSTPLKRTYIYALCEQLIAKKLITQTQQSKKTTYHLLSPSALLLKAEENKNAAESAFIQLEALLPTLNSQYILKETKPVVRVFEGVEGVKKAHREILDERKEILAYVRIDQTLDAPLEDFWPEYYKTRIERGIHVRSITPDTPEGIEYKNQDHEQFRETRLVSASTYLFEVEKNIVGNKVAFFSRTPDRMITTIIENEPIAQSERVIFELAWKGTSI
jgi:sugar-specific transcriptional regulator TrmB